MSFIDTLKNINPFRKQAPVVRQINEDKYSEFANIFNFALNQNNKSFNDRETISLAKRNPIVQSCVNVIGEAVIANGFDVVDYDEDIPTPSEDKLYVQQILENPLGLFGTETFQSLLMKIAKSLALYGDAFCEILENEEGILVGFKFIPAELIGYDEKNNQYYYISQPSLRYSEEELLHVSVPSMDYDNRNMGESPIPSIALSIRTMWNALNRNITNMNQEGLNLDHVLLFDKEISDTNFESQMQLLGEMASANSNGTMLALRGAQFQELNKTKDIDYETLLRVSRELIMAGFRVPPSKLGYIERGNLAADTGGSENRDFHQRIKALSDLIESQFNKVFIRKGYNVKFKLLESDIENHKLNAEVQQIYLNTGVLTINEVRQEMGLDPVEDGDELAPIRNANAVQNVVDAQIDKGLLEDFYENYDYENNSYID